MQRSDVWVPSKRQDTTARFGVADLLAAALKTQTLTDVAAHNMPHVLVHGDYIKMKPQPSESWSKVGLDKRMQTRWA